MAPPTQSSRRDAPRAAAPSRRRRRSPADLAAAAAAIGALAVLTFGVPVALVAVVGLPVPHTVPTLSLLTHRLDIAAILRVLSIVVWLAWVQLVACVVAEIRAAVRNSGMPARIPLAGGTQPLVHRLVTTALLVASATAALSPALVHPVPPRPPHTVSAAAVPGVGGPAPVTGPRGEAGPVAGAATAGRYQQTVDAIPVPASIPGSVPESRTEKIYVVKPPVGRYHESLWEIAQKHLGNGRRYREIFELNAGRVQPDGTELTIASLIRPGWVLRMPHDAHGPGIEIVQVRSHSGSPAARHPEGAGRDGLGAGGAAHADGAAQVGSAAHAGSTAHAGGAAPQGRADVGGVGGPQTAGPAPTEAPQAVAGTGGTAHEPHAYRYELAALSLLAAGLLSALGRRRRQQLWARAFGTRVVTPVAEAAQAEVSLRLAADEPMARLLDTGLRYLSQAMARQGRTPPTVFAAHIGSDGLDLWVALADQNAPEPWVAVGDGHLWRLPAAAGSGLSGQDGAAAPYPGLVSIGADATGRVLVDLESAHGLIAVTGPAPTVTDVLAAMAAELATNRWSDQMRITLVGFGDDLSALAPERIRAVATLAEALPAMEARTQQVQEALAQSGVESVLTGRSRGLHPAAWAPHYLITAVPPSPPERERLLALARARHSAATGYVIAGEVAGATWTWEVTAEGRLRAGLLGLDVQAHLLPPGLRSGVVGLFQTAAERDGASLGEMGPDELPEEQLDSGSPMPVEVTLLGPVSVRAPGVIGPDRLALAAEVVAYLATHPGGVHPNVLSAAIWPRGVTADVRDTVLSRVAEWLGTDGIGRPNLATDASGRLRLGSQVRVDWHVFRALVARSGAADARSGGEHHLARALSLVTGPFLAGRQPGRYTWLAADGLEYEVSARVADAAHRLGGLKLAAGDAHGAMDAARAGLRLARDDELLWRDLLSAAHATGRPALLRAVVEEVTRRAELDEVLPQLAPETEALIGELLPSWRAPVA